MAKIQVIDNQLVAEYWCDKKAKWGDETGNKGAPTGSARSTNPFHLQFRRIAPSGNYPAISGSDSAIIEATASMINGVIIAIIRTIFAPPRLSG